MTPNTQTQSKNQGAMSLSFLISIMVTAIALPWSYSENLVFSTGKVVAPGTYSSSGFAPLLFFTNYYLSDLHPKYNSNHPFFSTILIYNANSLQRIVLNTLRGFFAFICCWGCFLLWFGFETGPLGSKLPPSFLRSWGGLWTFTSLLFNSKLDRWLFSFLNHLSSHFPQKFSITLGIKLKTFKTGLVAQAFNPNYSRGWETGESQVEGQLSLRPVWVT